MVATSKSARTDTRSDKNSDLTTKDILRWSTVGAIDADLREGDRGNGGVELDEIATGDARLGILLGALHGSRSHGGHDSRANTETATEGLREVSNLTDVNRDVGILGGRCDGELSRKKKIHLAVRRAGYHEN
jgi:hypothetical protein